MTICRSAKVSINEMTRHLFQRLLKLLFHPFKFFEDVPENPRLLLPLLPILGICLAQSVWYSWVLVAHAEQLLGGAGGLPTGGFTLWFMAQLMIGPAVRWIVFTGIIFAVSMPFRGKGSFSRLLACTVYGIFIGYLISLIQAIFSTLAGRQITNEVSRLMAGSYLSFSNLATDPAIVVFLMIIWLLGAIGSLWTFIINVAATQYGRYIQRTHALLTVILAFVCMYGVVWMRSMFVRCVLL